MTLTEPAMSAKSANSLFWLFMFKKYRSLSPRPSITRNNSLHFGYNFAVNAYKIHKQSYLIVLLNVTGLSQYLFHLRCLCCRSVVLTVTRNYFANNQSKVLRLPLICLSFFWSVISCNYQSQWNPGKDAHQ